MKLVTLKYTQYGGEGYLRGGDEGVACEGQLLFSTDGRVNGFTRLFFAVIDCACALKWYCNQKVRPFHLAQHCPELSLDDDRKNPLLAFRLASRYGGVAQLVRAAES
jgi:hypothetical protein